MREHPHLCARYRLLTRDDLVRELAYFEMQRHGHKSARISEIQAWLKTRPRIKALVEKRMESERRKNSFTVYLRHANAEYEKRHSAAPRITGMRL